MENINPCVNCIKKVYLCQFCDGFFTISSINYHFKRCSFKPNKDEVKKIDLKKSNNEELCSQCQEKFLLCPTCNGYFAPSNYDTHISKCVDPDLEHVEQIDEYGYEYNNENEIYDNQNNQDYNYDNYDNNNNYDNTNSNNLVQEDKNLSFETFTCLRCKKTFELQTSLEYNVNCIECTYILEKNVLNVECSICKEKFLPKDIKNHESSCKINTKSKSKPNNTNSIYSDTTKVYGGSGKRVRNTELLDKWFKYCSLNRKLDNLDYENKVKAKFKEMIVGYYDNKDIIDTHRFRQLEKVNKSSLLQRIKSELLFWLKLDLPSDFNSSFFVRASSEYPQFIKFLIAGSRGSPYEHGLFEFDLYLPPDYPNKAPQCNIITTGNGKIRFNPNLYNTGKVCLSLLGTWRGETIENWDPKISNLTQLLISISSIVMNDNIGENEPGWESLTTSDKGLLENEAYSNIVRLGNIKYAMIEMIKNPPPCFREVVNNYFLLKGDEIIKDIYLWLERNKVAEVQYSGIANQNMSWCTELKNKGEYEKQINKDVEELTKLIEGLKEKDKLETLKKKNK